MVRIMIADDHILFRQIIREVIEKEKDLEVIAEAADGGEVIIRAAETQPDVVLMDLTMPVCDGFEATRRVLACSPRSRVVIFSASSQEHHVLHALQSGAIGYITKDLGPEELIAAIRLAARSELYMAQPLATRLLALLRTLKIEPVPIAPKPIPVQPGHTAYTRHVTGIHRKATHSRKKKDKRNRPLSAREKEVLGLIRQGQRNREIANELRIAESTVHKHVQNIFEKLDARNRAEALFLAKA